MVDQLQILYRNGLASTATWVEGGMVSVAPKEQAVFPLSENSLAYIRVVSTNFRGGASLTNLRVYAALGVTA